MKTVVGPTGLSELPVLKIADLRQQHDWLCGTYSRFHLLCQRCLRCVAASRWEQAPIPCPVCGDPDTEIYERDLNKR
jgi:hypothetical protein